MPDNSIDTDRARACTTAPRTLRCANRGLYLGMILIVLASALYVNLFRETGLYMACGSLAACIIALVWGGYYLLLRYEVDAQGVTRRLLRGGKRIVWAELCKVELVETDRQEVASATLRLKTPVAELELSSDLLALDDVLELARELKGEARLAD